MRRIFFLGHAAVSAILLASIPSFSEEKGGVWESTTLSMPFYDLEGVGPTTLKFENANRWEDGSSHYEVRHFQGSWVIPIPNLEGWSWEPGYRRTIENPGDRDQAQVDRYLLHLNGSRGSLFGSEWDFDFRNRWELLDPENDSDQTLRARFRGRLARDLPGMSTEGRNWRFWISDEIFYDFDRDLLSQNRLAAGIEIPLFEDFDLSLGLQWEATRATGGSSSWEDDHMFLLEFRWNLPESFISD